MVQIEASSGGSKDETKKRLNDMCAIHSSAFSIIHASRCDERLDAIKVWGY